MKLLYYNVFIKTNENTIRSLLSSLVRRIQFFNIWFKKKRITFSHIKYTFHTFLHMHVGGAKSMCGITQINPSAKRTLGVYRKQTGAHCPCVAYTHMYVYLDGHWSSKTSLRQIIPSYSSSPLAPKKGDGAKQTHTDIQTGEAILLKIPLTHRHTQTHAQPSTARII